MNFGGYVSYTVGGFRCQTFGAAEVTSIIAHAAAELDIPQSISLRAGRKGLRRTVLKAPAGQTVVYSAFVGLSEPKVNRLGSFLAIGVAVGPEMGWASKDIGYYLCELLDDLAKRVSDGNRFAFELTIEILNVFLREKSTILEEMYAGFAPVSQALGPKSGQGLIYLSDKGIWGTPIFNQVCTYLLPEANFFLFDDSAKSEVQSARHDFRISAWPIPVVQEKFQAVRPDMANEHQQNRQAQPQNLWLKERAGESAASEAGQPLKRLEEGARRDNERIGAIEDILALWKNLQIVAFASLILLLMVVAYLSYQWKSTTDRKVLEIREQLRTFVADSARRASAPSIEQPIRSNAGPQNSTGESMHESRGSEVFPVQQIVKLSEGMNYDQILKKYCSGYQGKNFKSELDNLNPGAMESNGVIRGGKMVLLPAGCAAPFSR